MKIRLTGTPDEVRRFQNILIQLKDFEATRISKEYGRKYRYNDEISIYIDMRERSNT